MQLSRYDHPHPDKLTSNTPIQLCKALAIVYLVNDSRGRLSRAVGKRIAFKIDSHATLSAEGAGKAESVHEFSRLVKGVFLPLVLQAGTHPEGYVVQPAKRGANVDLEGRDQERATMRGDHEHGEKNFHWKSSSIPWLPVIAAASYDRARLFLCSDAYVVLSWAHRSIRCTRVEQVGITPCKIGRRADL